MPEDIKVLPDTPKPYSPENPEPVSGSPRHTLLGDIVAAANRVTAYVAEEAAELKLAAAEAWEATTEAAGKAVDVIEEELKELGDVVQEKLGIKDEEGPSTNADTTSTTAPAETEISTSTTPAPAPTTGIVAEYTSEDLAADLSNTPPPVTDAVEAAKNTGDTSSLVSNDPDSAKILEEIHAEMNAVTKTAETSTPGDAEETTETK